MGKNLMESYCYRMDLYRIRAPTLVIPLSCLCHFQNLTNVITRSWKLWESMAYQRECLKAESLVCFFSCHFKVFLTSNNAISIAKFWVTGVKYLISHLQSFSISWKLKSRHQHFIFRFFTFVSYSFFQLNPHRWFQNLLFPPLCCTISCNFCTNLVFF